MPFPPFFIPFQSFYSPNMLFGHIFAPPPPGRGQQKKKHPRLFVVGNPKFVMRSIEIVHNLMQNADLF